MKKYVTFLCCILCCISCSEPKVKDQVVTEKNSRQTTITIVDSLEKDFAGKDVIGSFVLFDQNKNEYFVYNDSLAQQSICPASTFKIFNALVALETGILKNTSEMIKWDGKDRGWDKWNQDHNLATGMKYSAVWTFQEIAKRVHAQDSLTYQRLLDKSKYGNQKIGEDITMFWLDNSLQISPFQEIDFLRKLYHNDLPFGEKTMDSVKDIIVVERGADYVLRAKTGWAILGERNIGWYVGYLEKAGNVYYFCSQVRKNGEIKDKASFRNTYVGIAKKILLSRN